jgi:hypothetical protein
VLRLVYATKMILSLSFAGVSFPAKNRVHAICLLFLIVKDRLNSSCAVDLRFHKSELLGSCSIVIIPLLSLYYRRY